MTQADANRTQERIRIIACCGFAPFLVALLYAYSLGYRPDYLGHYAAGYGGTLSAMALVLTIASSEHYMDDARLYAALACVGCIALGAVAESTVFRIAKFDEIDFCNQSLGAVLAGLASLAACGRRKPSVISINLLLVLALGYLGAGFYYAFQ